MRAKDTKKRSFDLFGSWKVLLLGHTLRLDREREGTGGVLSQDPPGFAGECLGLGFEGLAE